MALPEYLPNYQWDYLHNYNSTILPCLLCTLPHWKDIHCGWEWCQCCSFLQHRFSTAGCVLSTHATLTILFTSRQQRLRNHSIRIIETFRSNVARTTSGRVKEEVKISRIVLSSIDNQTEPTVKWEISSTLPAVARLVWTKQSLST